MSKATLMALKRANYAKLQLETELRQTIKHELAPGRRRNRKQLAAKLTDLLDRHAD